MNAQPTIVETVSDVLRTSTEYLDLQQIVKAAGQPESAVKAVLRVLAAAGQIDHIAGAGRRPTRYGWLSSAKPVVPAAPSAEPEPPSPGQPDDSDLVDAGWHSVPSQPVPSAVTLDALRDDIATTLRMSGIAAFANVSSESDLALAVAGLVEEYRKAQMRPVPTEPGEPQGAAYLVKASKRKPRITRDKDAACAAALAAARSGSRRAEVFALHPIGAAKRGAEWSEAL